MEQIREFVAEHEIALRSTDTPTIAVILPCYNEDAAIAQTVADFRAALPHADIYVYDNNSSDRTAEVAGDAGAIVRCEKMQGKGHVVRRMFADVALRQGCGQSELPGQFGEILIHAFEAAEKVHRHSVVFITDEPGLGNEMRRPHDRAAKAGLQR